MRYFFVLSVLTFIFPFLMNAQVIYVDVHNNTGIEDGTEAHPYNTIREGINAAVQGNQVLIRQGTYIPDESWSGNNQTLFLKAGVRLAGEGRDNTIISGIIVDQQASNLPVGLENLAFDEFHFVRSTVAGPFGDKNIVRNCATNLISLAFGPGVQVNDTTPGPNHGFLVENNDLGNPGIIEFKQGAGSSELNVTGNTCGYIYLKSGGGYTYLIDDNDVRSGIFDMSAKNTTTISNNRIFNGTIEDRSGGNQYGAEDEIIENNTIAANEDSPAFIDADYKAGITAMSRSATIRNNTITCTGHVSGIRSSAGAPLHMTGNTITLDEVQVPDPDPKEGTIGIFNYSGWGYVNGNKIKGGGHGYYSKAGTIEFSGNEIEKSYTGFYSMGAEAVHHNTILNCKGDGMILDGLKGPLYHNEVRNNGGAGIRITRVPVDLGGGADSSPGLNTIMGNADFDLYIETVSTQYPVVYARHNIWDHASPDGIRQYDIHDGLDSTGLPVADILPLGNLGTDDPVKIVCLNAIPNPCRESATISWQSGECSPAVIIVYDVSGKAIRTLVCDMKEPGLHRVIFDTNSFPAGVYYYQLQANGKTESGKLVVYK